MADGLTESVRDDRGAFDPDFVARVTQALELGDRSPRHGGDRLARRVRDQMHVKAQGGLSG